MGQTMACCGKSDIDSNDIKTNDFTNQYTNLKHSDKEALIVKIQAAYRGHRARKRVSKMRSTRGGGPGMQHF